MVNLGVILSGRLDLDDLERARRWRKTAATWTSKAVASLRYAHDRAPDVDVRAHFQWEASRLYQDLIWDSASLLVPLLHESELDDAERWARELAGKIRRRRLAGKLGTEGRTPEEAAAFRAKAEELGGGS